MRVEYPRSSSPTRYTGETIKQAYVLSTSKRASFLDPPANELAHVDPSLQNQYLRTDLRRVLKRIRKSACKSDLRPINVCRLALGGQTMKILSRLKCEFELDPPRKWGGQSRKIQIERNRNIGISIAD